VSRAEAKAATRERLLHAAEQVFARKGFAGASVEEIAETAGYSIGALYSNFDSKEQLFLELLSARRARRAGSVVATLRAAVAEHRDPLEALPGALMAFADRDADAAALQAEFWLYAVRNPQARAALAAQTATQLDALEELITEVLARDPAAGATPPREVTVAVFALVQGLIRQRRIDPDRVPDELFTQALRWILTGVRADGNKPK
jgi:AcrR family transcriptional regulator